MEKELERFKELRKEINDYNYMSFVLSYDANTDCPKDGVEESFRVSQVIENKILDICRSDEYVALLNYLFDNKDIIKDEITKSDIVNLHKSLQKLMNVPKEEMSTHLENLDSCYFSWVKGRESNDYQEFLKNLEELVAFNKRYIKYQENDKIKGFDVLLDEMEDNASEKLYDEFFLKIEKEIVPLAKSVLKKKKLYYNPKLDNGKYSIEKQRILSNKICNLMGYTNKNGCIRETIHPFTNGVSNRDVRITTNYSEELLFSNIFTIMHETGHALYDINHSDKLNGTSLFGGSSCAIHESQSRFYENYLGRSRSFIHFIYPELMDLFKDELKGITEEDIYYYVNTPKAQFTRVEADELTYPIHVLIRYKIEKLLFNDEITVYDISSKFNELMHEYLGITPPNDTIGCFQDIHWSSGFAYFPTYALGSAFGAQFLNSMKKDFDCFLDMSKGDFSRVNAWLKENIHQYGAFKKNFDIIKDTCKEEFNPDYYINYLKDKFSQF